MHTPLLIVAERQALRQAMVVAAADQPLLLVHFNPKPACLSLHRPRLSPSPWLAHAVRYAF